MREWGGCEWGVKTESERERNGLKGKKDNKTNKNTHPLAAWSVLINFLIFHCSTALSVSEEFSDILRQEEKGSERERGRRGRDGLLAREQRTMRKNESTFFFFFPSSLSLFLLPCPRSYPFIHLTSAPVLHRPFIQPCLLRPSPRLLLLRVFSLTVSVSQSTIHHEISPCRNSEP